MSSHFEPQARISLAEFVPIFIELLAITLAIWYLGLEQISGFTNLLPVIVLGFVLHSFLPIKYRPVFFLVLSWIGILIVVPPPHGLVILGIGLIIFLICHVPIPLSLRVGAILIIGALLAAIRTGAIETAWVSLGTLVVPIVGSLFMFRLIIYLHDLPHEKERPPLSQRLSYFFMLPNVCFLLFPVVDYQTYKRKYYDATAVSIYRKGTWWMFRGVTHLLLYRIIYLNIVPSTEEVSGIWGVAHAMVATYLLYLRISGQFHLIAGIMCLFGHNFLETNHLYYLASSASDYWRRINIYWKDFMTRIFYNHAFVWFKKAGVVRAVMLSMVYVFVVTWALHSYQWMWLKGEFPIAPKDLIFWTSFMLLAMGGVYFEMKKVRTRRTGPDTFRQALGHASRVVATFTTIAILWSLWSSSSLAEFALFISEVANSTGLEVALFVVAVVGIIFLGATVRFVLQRLPGREDKVPIYERKRFAWYPGFASLILVAVVVSGVSSSLPDRAATIVNSASSGSLNRIDEEVLEAGYYESLLEPTDYLKSLWTNSGQRPSGWGSHLYDLGAARYTDDILLHELVPSTSVKWRKKQFSTNSLGMRDREYDPGKPENVIRIGLLGSSKEMGWGVGDDDTFESIIESEFTDTETEVQILNYSVHGYTEIQLIHMVDDGRFDNMSLDALLICTHAVWRDKIAETIHKARRGDIDLEYPILIAAADSLGIDGVAPYRQYKDAFRPFAHSIADWAYGRIAEYAAEKKIPVFVMALPTINRPDAAEEVSVLASLAEKHAMQFVDVSDTYAGQNELDIRLAPWDSHPNERAHALIAKRILELMPEDIMPVVLESRSTSKAPGTPDALSIE